MIRHMTSLTDSQLQTLMETAAKLSPDRRDLFLQRVGAMLGCEVASRMAMLQTWLALCGLIQQQPAA